MILLDPLLGLKSLTEKYAPQQAPWFVCPGTKLCSSWKEWSPVRVHTRDIPWKILHRFSVYKKKRPYQYTVYHLYYGSSIQWGVDNSNPLVGRRRHVSTCVLCHKTSCSREPHGNDPENGGHTSKHLLASIPEVLSAQPKIAYEKRAAKGGPRVMVLRNFTDLSR